MRVSPVAVAAHTRITAVGGASRTALIPSRTGCQPPRVALAARAHAVTAVRLSAPQSADRSVQPRSNRRCALPHLIAPPRGTVVSTGAAALCPCGGFFSPPHPLQGLCGSLATPGGKRLRRSCRCPSVGVLSPCPASQCTAAGLLRQGPASRRARGGRPPPSGRQRRLYAAPSRPRCWRTAVAGPVCAGGEAAHARAGRGTGGDRWTVWGQRALGSAHLWIRRPCLPAGQMLM